ncbi:MULTISPECIES: three component ABC system middle component [unclassified Azospirillum]|jgi:hypothetical protein|uniref:three component ABC system middle component n=1 Tax=unclassified Azospirillum TaxID=2630922 RepID=UPI0011B28A2A|nr:MULTISPECIES: three component ABC system middle component [unclassified Azospirillum]
MDDAEPAPIQSRDILANTNPAYCALILRGFSASYLEAAGEGADFSVMFFVLPLCLSEKYAYSFDGTNKKTGLFTWIHRSPIVSLELSCDVDKTHRFTRAGLSFALQQKMMSIGHDGRFSVLSEGIRPKQGSRLAIVGGEPLKRSDRLGTWMGEIKSPSLIFNILGVSV